MRSIHNSAFLLLTLLLSMVACKGRNSVRDLYKFPNTKDVQVEVNVGYTATLNGEINPSIDFSGRIFFLNAFALDADGQQVAMTLGGDDPVNDLPVTLASNHTSFNIIMRLPLDVQPGPTGYSFRFELKDASASSLRFLDETQNLDALRGDVKAGTNASDNKVDLSIASTLAYQLIKNANADLLSSKTMTTYSAIIDDLKTQQSDLELVVDTAATHSVSAYVEGMLSALGYKLITDKSLQAIIVTALLDTVQVGATDDATKNSIAETFAKSFTTLLSTLAQNAKTNLGDRTLNPAKVFTGQAINADSLADVSTISDAVFAPSGLAFTDTDSSTNLGGAITITPPLINRGVASYNVYFGGESRTDAKGALIGNVLVSGSNAVTLSLPAGTAQLTYTRFWAFPLADGGELDLPATLVIVNVGGTSNPPASPTNVAAVAGFRENIVSWSDVTGATSYNIYWSKVSPVTTSSSKIPGVTTPYIHAGLAADQKYYYIVTAIKNSRESAPSGEASATSLGTGPATPKSLAVTAGSGSNTLTWEAVTGASAYNLYWFISPYVTKSSNKLASVTSPYQHAGIAGGETYYYAIAAVAGGVEGRLSPVVSATQLLLAPSGLNAAAENGSNFIDWTPVNGATAYKIYWGTSPGISTGSTIITSTQRPYRHKSLANGTTYYYAVAAVGNMGDSDLSSEANAQPVGVPFSWIGALSSSTVTSGWSTSTTAPTRAVIDGALDRPLALAVDAKNGYLYVGDHSQTVNSRRVSKFNLTTGAYIGSIGYLSASTGTCPSSGAAPGWCTGGTFISNNSDGGFGYAAGIDVDPATDSLYITDWAGNKINKFVASTGAFVGAIGYVSSVAGGGTCVASAVASTWCKGGTFAISAADGGFSQPYAIVVDSAGGNLYVDDMANFRIVKHRTTGAFVGALGLASASTGTCPASGATTWCTGGTFASSSADGGFTNSSQSTMAINVDGDALYWTGGGYFVTKITLSTGAFVGRVGITTSSSGTCAGSGAATTWCAGGSFTITPNDGGFATALGIDVDPISGSIYVGDGLTYRLKRLNGTTGAFEGAKGKVTATSGTCPSSGATPSFCTGGTFSKASPTLGTFDYIGAVKQADNGYIYVADILLNRIQRVAK